MNSRTKLFRLGGLVMGLLGMAGMAGDGWAQAAYPVKPIRLIVSFAAGGTNDLLARLLAPEMQKDFGQSVIVDNRAGAGGAIGAAVVAKAVPDGYTLLMTTNVFSINPALRKDLPFDPLKDFTPITLLVTSPNMLAVSPDSPMRNVADFLAAAKARPGELSYATSGIGTSLHIAMEQFAQLTGTRYNHIPYAAANQSVQALLAGQVNSTWSGMFSALPLLKSNKMRALAVANEVRSVFAPDIPTFAESGVKGMRSETWHAALGPAGLPQSITLKMNATFMKLLQLPNVKETLAHYGVEHVGLEMERFGARIREEIGMYSTIVRAAGIKVE